MPTKFTHGVKQSTIQRFPDCFHDHSQDHFQIISKINYNNYTVGVLRNISLSFSVHRLSIINM